MPSQPNIFISSAAGVDTKVLRSLLQELKTTPVDAFDFQTGDSIAEKIVQKIAKCQGIIAVYPENSPNVAYEFGMASALNKPVLILVNPVGSLPTFIQTYTYQRTNLQDTVALRVTLDQFIKDVRATRRRPKHPPAKNDSNTNVQPDFSLLLDRVRQQRIKNSPQDVERLASDVLIETGLQVEVNSVLGAGVDCIIWSDKLATTTGNPILVEIKSGNISQNRLEQAEKQLAEYMHAADAPFGLILYLDREGKRIPANRLTSTPIIRWDLEDFIEQLQFHPFETVVLTKRNELAHGGIK